jgi:hypothetical protein
MIASVVPLLPSANFDATEWARYTEPLRAVERRIRQHAAASGCAVLSSSIWPELGLRRRGLAAISEVRISLASARDHAAPNSWVVRAAVYPRWYLVEPPVPRPRNIRVLSSVEAGDAGLVVDILRSALEKVR